jgi:hypothetical protein
MRENWLREKNMNVCRTSNFATGRQELLLRAAVSKGQAAADAWQEWSRTADIEKDVDRGSFRLLPLLYVNLQQMGIDDPLMGRLKGIYRQSWSRNQTLFHDMAKVVDNLQSSGIKTMLLKGAALSLLYYKNNGARPMADIDVLIPRAKARLAHDLLIAAGWVPTPAFNEGLLEYDHSVHFTNPHGQEFDLHWRLFHGCCQDEENDLWDGAAPVKMAGVAALAPNPTDMLFHAIIHGVVWNPEPPIRWVADAMSLIHSPDVDIDWTRLIALAKKYRVGLRLKKGMEYLCARFQTEIPPAVMETVRHLPVTYLEKMEYRFLMTPLDIRRNRPYNTFCYHLFVYRRLTSKNRWFSPGGFAGYLKWVMHAGSLTALLYRLMHRGVHLIKSVLFKGVAENDNRKHGAFS